MKQSERTAMMERIDKADYIGRRIHNLESALSHAYENRQAKNSTISHIMIHGRIGADGNYDEANAGLTQEDLRAMEAEIIRIAERRLEVHRAEYDGI